MEYNISNIAACLGIIVSTASLIYAHLSNKAQKLALTNQGAFKNTQLSIQIFKTTDKYANFIYGIPEAQDVSFYAVPIFIHITNNGEKTAEDIEIFIRAPKHMLIDRDALSKEDKDAGYRMIKGSDTNSISSYIISISYLHPKSAMAIMLPFRIAGSTIQEREMDFKTADGYDAIAKYFVLFSFFMEITIFQKDYDPINRNINILSIVGNHTGYRDLINKYNIATSKNAAKLKPMDVWKRRKIKRPFYLLIFNPKDMKMVNTKVKNTKVRYAEIQTEKVKYYSGYFDGFDHIILDMDLAKPKKGMNS